jgi:hypothetical protein
MQEMIQIQAVVCGLPPGIVFRRRVDAGQRYTLCPCVDGRPRFWTSSSDVAEQHDGTPSFRQKSAGEQGPVLRGHRGSNRDADAVQISQQLGFRGDVGLASFRRHDSRRT